MTCTLFSISSMIDDRHTSWKFERNVMYKKRNLHKPISLHTEHYNAYNIMAGILMIPEVVK